jgi:hypothetical protein
VAWRGLRQGQGGAVIGQGFAARPVSHTFFACLP